MAHELEELSPSISIVDDSVTAVNAALKPLFESNTSALSSKVYLDNCVLCNRATSGVTTQGQEPPRSPVGSGEAPRKLKLFEGFSVFYY